jgi:signal peptide peptidase SppA
MSDTAHRLGRIVAEVSETLWAILPAKLAAIVALLQIRATGQRLSEDEIRAAIGAQAEKPALPLPRNGIAIVPVFGVLGQRMNIPLAMSGGTSTERLAAELRALRRSEHVRAIVLAIDSPGGSCHGVDELASEIRTARGTKPIVAVATSTMASAAYWVGAQADRIVVTPGGDVGSIGVITAHEDLSGAQEKLGVKTTLIAAGKYKAEANPFAPLTDEARAALQRRVDEAYSRFVTAVARGRGISERAVRDGYGQGRLLPARDALAAGMVDDIATIDEVITDLATTSGARALDHQSHARATPQELRGIARAATGQEPSRDDWQRRIDLDLRLLEL